MDKLSRHCNSCKKIKRKKSRAKVSIRMNFIEMWVEWFFFECYCVRVSSSSPFDRNRTNGNFIFVSNGIRSSGELWNQFHFVGARATPNISVYVAFTCTNNTTYWKPNNDRKHPNDGIFFFFSQFSFFIQFSLCATPKLLLKRSISVDKVYCHRKTLQIV